MKDWFADIAAQFKLNFIDGNRWQWLAEGFKTTLIIAFFATVLGICIGVLIATIRSTYDKTGESLKKRGGAGVKIFGLADRICKLYLTVIRGTPMVVQLLIMYFIIFKSSTRGTLVAIISFGINSGAYVAEIFRGGIMSVDNGQFEAGRSLGFNYAQTMFYIIIPPAVKNILPALGNEMITLLKDTSLVSVIALRDVTKQAQNIQSLTYNALVPYISLAAIYLVLVVGLTKLLAVFERRLRKSEH